MNRPSPLQANLPSRDGDVIVTAAALHSLIRTIVGRGGSGEGESTLVANQLVDANLAGHDSHGVGMIPRYVDALLEGDLHPNQHVTVYADNVTFMLMDGNRGYGQTIGLEAMGLGIRRAMETGIAVLGLRNTHHLGRIGYWAEQCARAGLVSIHFVNVITRPIVAPWGGSDARLGTNPFTVGIPLPDRAPVIVDFATSRVAQGKVRVSFNRGEPLPPETLLDDQGRPTCDPRYGVVEPYGAVLPFAEHKGYALAVACEMLGGALAGGHTLHVRETERRRIYNGILSILIHPARMGTAINLEHEAEAFIRFACGSPPRPGVEHVRLPGDPEVETRADRVLHGIPVDVNTWREVVAAGMRLGVAAEELHARRGRVPRPGSPE